MNAPEEQSNAYSQIQTEAPAVTPSPARHSLQRLRRALLIHWLIYSALLLSLLGGLRYLDGLAGDILSFNWISSIALAILSAPGHIALLFWRFLSKTIFENRAQLFIPKRLSLQLQGLSILSFLSNLLMFLCVSFASLPDAVNFITLGFGLPVALLSGGLIWMVFFKKDAGYISLDSGITPPISTK